MTNPTQNNILTYSLCSSNLEVRIFTVQYIASCITTKYFLHVFHIMLGVLKQQCLENHQCTICEAPNTSFAGVIDNFSHRYIMTNLNKGVNPSKNKTNLTAEDKKLYRTIHTVLTLRKFKLPYFAIRAILFLILTPLLILSCKQEKTPCKRLKKAPTELIQGDDISHITKNIARGNK